MRVIKFIIIDSFKQDMLENYNYLLENESH
jgi:hypothetical protein